MVSVRPKGHSEIPIARHSRTVNARPFEMITLYGELVCAMLVVSGYAVWEAYVSHEDIGGRPDVNDTPW